MAMNGLKRSFFESMIDAVSIKSGLILSESKAVEILNRSVTDEGWWNGDLNTGIRIHYAEYEDDFLSLLYAVGAISSCHGPVQLAVRYARKILGPDSDMDKTLQFVSGIQYGFMELFLNGNAKFIQKYYRLDGFSEFSKEYSRRNPQCLSCPEEVAWENPINLNDLFTTEEINACSGDESLIDQRFIEYLNKNSIDLCDINWRQFEYLTGEFFRRLGYKVTVTQGRQDGGIDVIAETTHPITGPEKIYVQCKRYTKNVGLDSVRAFWSTVSDDGATKGIIATTSCLTSNAKEFCKARKYRMNQAEQPDVVNWIGSMSANKAIQADDFGAADF